jgi:DNA processing protein
MRNRIISGLSFGVLVVEAPERSGSLITAKMALEQNRTVYAVPGRIDQPYSKGCHQLIKDGAKLVEGVEDILAETQFLFRLPEQTTNPVARAVPENLSDAEKTLFETLGKEEVFIDQLIHQSGLPAPIVSSALLKLEMKKLVRQLPGKVFVRTA